MSRKRRRNDADQRCNPTETFAAAAPPRPRADSLQPPATGRAISATWEAWEVGPYVRWPEPRKRVHEFWLMRTFDPVIRTALALLRTLILSRLGTYSHPDPEVEARVTGWLDGIAGGPKKVVAELLSALWAGFAVVELRWGLGPEWTVESTALLHPLTFFARHGRESGLQLDPQTGRVEVFRQLPQAPGEEVIEFGRERVLYWPAFAELREQVYGASLLEAARPVWFARVRLANYWNTYCEKIACPTPVIHVPVDTVEDPETGQVVSAAQFITDLFSQLEPGMSVALPYTPGQEWRVEPLVVSGDGGRAFEARLAQLEREMWLAVLTPRLLLAEPEYGTRAQAQAHLDLFMDAVDGIRAEVGEVLVEQLIARLISWNIGPDVEPGEWSWRALTDEDVERLARVLQAVETARTTAWQRGGPDEADERKWREVFRAVLAPADELEGRPAYEDAEQLAARVRATARRYGL